MARVATAFVCSQAGATPSMKFRAVLEPDGEIGAYIAGDNASNRLVSRSVVPSGVPERSERPRRAG